MRAILGFIFFFALQTTFGQQFNFKRFSVEEGLPRASVYCVFEDSRGYLWAGLDGGGLSRFDGREFVNYTVTDGLAGNTIRSICEDTQGNLWMTTDGQGVSKFDGSKFTNYSTQNGLSSDYARTILQGPEGDIWVGTSGGGIDRLHLESDSLRVTNYNTDGALKSNAIRCGVVAKDGSIWFGTEEGISVFKKDTWQQLTFENGLPGNRISTIYEDDLNRIWIAAENGVMRWGDTTKVFNTETGLSSNRVRAICQDDLGNLWFGTMDGVSRFDGTNVVTFTEKNGLCNDRIRGITKDRSGDLWFATNFGGLCRFSGQDFIHFTKTDGLTSDQVQSILIDSEGKIWLGTLEGLTILSRSSDGTWNVEPDPIQGDLVARGISCMAQHADGSMWFGTFRGIIIAQNGTSRWFEADGERFNETVRTLHFDDDGSVWVGSRQGTTRFQRQTNGYSFDQYHSNPNINQSTVSCFLKDGSQRLWIGYLDSEPVIFQNGEFKNPSVPKALNDVSTMVQGLHGDYWIATEGNGLFRFKPSGDTIAPSDFKQYGLEDGLSSMDLRQLVFDSEKNLWVGTATGLDRVELNDRGEPVKVSHFGRTDGFVGTETNENAVTMDADGNLWFGTIRGITRYAPKSRRLEPVEAKLHIIDVRIEFQKHLWETSEHVDGQQGYFRLPLGLRLPYSSNNLVITYDAIDLRSPEKVRYQWKLDGYTDEWSQIEERNAVTLTNLPSGSYTFMVRACNGDGIWNQEPATFQFTVLPPFWLTWWFITLASIATVGLIILIIKVREKRLQAEKLRLQNMVDERTKELREEKERSDELLLNILPYETAEELKLKGYASVQQYDRVSVLFTDFVGFTNITEGISHQQLVSALDEHFRMFDEVMDKYGIEKIKTIGDAYMAAGGIPTRTITNPLSVVAAGLEMVHRLAELNETKHLKGEQAWQLRLGIHTGSVISGVVGKNKFAFDIWGDAVNTAARMESSGEVMKVNVSGSTYELIKEYFDCTPRGKIKAKNKGEIEMYFVNRLKPEFSETANGLVANATFIAVVGIDGKKFSMPN